MALVIGIFLELLQVIFMNHYRHRSISNETLFTVCKFGEYCTILVESQDVSNLFSVVR